MLVCLTVLFSLMILTPSYLNASNNDPMFFRKYDSPYGIPYSEWPKIWWQWSLSIPNNEHPAVHYDSTKCSVHQKGPVWFLPDVVSDAPITTKQFSCEIPTGKAILFPLSTGSCWFGDPGFPDMGNKTSSNPGLDSQLKECATIPQDNTKISYVRINGTELDVSKLDRVTSSFFNLTIPANPVKEIFYFLKSGGTARAIADGYFLFLRPLPEGRYLIEFQANDKIGGQAVTTRAGQYTVFVK
jgi:hypothetical protein